MTVAVLTGGVGGAKLVLGLANVLPPVDVAAIVNTGDDFRHFGLHISPDVDTLLYTLSGKASQAQGWGRANETWSFMSALRTLGGEDWFQLGDGDLALHIARTAQLAGGRSLSEIATDFARAWNIAVRVMPMSDQAVTTWVHTDEGTLEFQRYFVERRCAPKVSAVEFRGARQAVAAPGVVEAIESADAVLIAPSNPYLSIDPILALPEIRAALQRTRSPRVAISPLVGGRAVKGPTAKMMVELGVQVSNESIVRHYQGLIDAILIDEGDQAPTEIAVGRTQTLMQTLEDRMRVARASLVLAASLRSDRQPTTQNDQRETFK